jgi:ligand-binding SRPBCC domain-containing protein
VDGRSALRSDLVPNIHVETYIAAPPERCFDIARDVEAHADSTSATHERAVAGVTTGLLELNDEVTWEATHLGIRQRLTARITRFERPYLFEDVLVKGAFHSFTHIHAFRQAKNGTLMVDDFHYRSPLGVFGAIADKLFLTRYMTRFLTERARYLKRSAEAAGKSNDESGHEAVSCS